MDLAYPFWGAAIGGFISRMCGRKSVIPFGLEQWLYALPYGLIFIGSLWGIPAYIAAVLGKRTGHGQYIHLGYLPRQDYSMDEKLDFLLVPFFGVDRGGAYWRSVAFASSSRAQNVVRHPRSAWMNMSSRSNRVSLLGRSGW